MISNPTIAAAVAAVEATRAKGGGKARAALAADLRDYLEGMTQLSLPFNAHGIAIKGSTVFYMGAPQSLAVIATAFTTAAWDDVALNALAAEFQSALEQAAK